jgi:hypothetical protein
MAATSPVNMINSTVIATFQNLPMFADNPVHQNTMKMNGIAQ